MGKLLSTTNEVSSLIETLKKYDCVAKYDSNDELEATRLAHSLSDMESAFFEIMENYLPSLLEADSEESVKNSLIDIGDEIRHILYHIKDPRFFSYLLD